MSVNRILGIYNRYKGKLTRLSRATFSECGEDFILEQVMNMCGLTKFQFIDVGSNHPKRSNDFYRSY